MDDFLFFDCLRLFHFLLIDFHCIFSISYKILASDIYYHCILIRIVYAVGTYFFFRDCFTFFLSHDSLLTFFVCFSILFHSCCSHVRVFGKTLVHEFHISYRHTEWYLLFFPTVQLQVSNVYSKRKTRNS